MMRIHWITLAAFIAGCGGGGTNGTVEMTPRAPHAAISEPLTGPDATPGREQPSRPGSSPLLLIFGTELGGPRLYTVSAGAREAVPSRIPAPDHLDYREAAPVPGTSLVAVVAEQRYGSGRTIRLVSFETGSSATLFESQDQVLSQLSVSQDGRLLAFSVRPVRGNGRPQVYLVDLASGSLLVAGSGEDPSFSGDGETLYYIEEGGSRIASVGILRTVDGKSESSGLQLERAPSAMVSSASGAIRQFRLSPGGERYFYLRGRGADSELVIGKVGEEAQELLTASRTSSHEPSWSSDGERILFWSKAQAKASLAIHDLLSGETALVAEIQGDEPGQGTRVCPAWSPDQASIYFSTRSGTGSRVYRLDRKSGRRQLLTHPNFPGSYFCPRILKTSGDLR